MTLLFVLCVGLWAAYIIQRWRVIQSDGADEVFKYLESREKRRKEAAAKEERERQREHDREVMQREDCFKADGDTEQQVTEELSRIQERRALRAQKNAQAKRERRIPAQKEEQAERERHAPVETEGAKVEQSGVEAVEEGAIHQAPAPASATMLQVGTQHG